MFCIKNENKRALTQAEEILNRWIEYFANYLMKYIQASQT